MAAAGGGSGYVGGDPMALATAAAALARVAEEVAGVVTPFVTATGSAAGAAGVPAAEQALAECRARWGGCLDELAGQVRALSVVVAAAGHDLSAAAGS